MKLWLTLLSVVLISSMGFAQPLGEIIGSTYYISHNFGSAGNRTALCDDGTIHVCWTCAPNWPPPPRHVCYNWRDASGTWHTICQVDDRPDATASAGFPTLDIYQGYRVAFSYHYTTPQYVARLAVDDADYPGYCFFQRYNVLNSYGGVSFLWPHIAVDHIDNIHIVMTEPAPAAGDPMRIIYTRSNDGGLNWTDIAVVDTLMTISVIVVASPVSDRAAICYTHPNDLEVQWDNEIYYIVSDDGHNWDWDHGKIQVTDYESSGSDQRAYAEVEALFDLNDNLHLIWPTFSSISGGSWLWHYDEVSDTITLIAHNPDSLAPTPPWQLSINQISLSRGEDNLFAVWTNYSEDDISFEGVPNGEIYMSQSSDTGLTWTDPVNITNTPSPDCLPGDCTSEIYSNAAEDTDSLPHITYIFDSGEPEALVMYLGPDHIVGIDDNKDIHPVGFTLYQNYPNPFNVSTIIKYNLPKESDVTIDIYDILGRKVETLLSEKQQAGSHSLIWQAEELKSGIYFYKITAADFSQTKKMILLR